MVEQLAYAGGCVGEHVLVGGEHLGGGETADAFEGVEVVAEGVGDRGVVGGLVQAGVRGAASRSGATCSSGAPAATSLAVMYANQRPGRVSRVRRTIAVSAACMAIQAPDASRTLPERPWWSGWWWVMTTPCTSP